jgi:hypothetical protein
MRRHMLYRVFLSAGLFFFLAAAHAQLSTLRLNEVLASNTKVTPLNGDGTITDLVEIYNSGTIAVDMGGCSLTDSNTNPRRYTFPANSWIEPHAFHVIQFDSRYTNAPLSSLKVPFGVKASGGFLVLYGPPSDPQKYDELEYGLQLQDFSLGRVTDGTGPWQLTAPTLGSANVAVELGSRSGIKINEWLVKESSGSDFIELFNPTNKPVEIGGMYLTDTLTSQRKFQIPARSFIGTGWISGFLRFKADGDATTPRYPADELNFKLSDREQIGLSDTDGQTYVDFIPPTFLNYGDQTSDISQGRLPDGSANIVFFPKINDYETRSPAEPNFLILPYTNNPIVSELLSHTDPPLEDAVEIQNRAGTNVNLSGWWLSNSRLNRKRYLIPNGPAIPPGGFQVIYEGVGSTSGFNTASALDPFTFNSAHGDNIVLSQVDANGNLTGYIIYEEFEAAANGIPFGHYDTSVAGDYKFVAMSATTFGRDEANNVTEFRQGTGKTNAYPKIGPVVINEIMFAPQRTLFGTNVIVKQNPEEEFIELRNITSSSVPLYDPQYPTNHWKLQKAIEFVLPTVNLAPNSFCLVVGFDPSTNAAALANFRSRFNVSNDVPIFGPWIGQLNDGGDSIEFYRPDPVQLPPHPDAGFVPYVRIDKVNYKTSLPWPGGANETGFSLQRKNSLLFGNDPFNWASDAPNPGRASIALQDTDGDGMPDGWETDQGFAPNNSTDAAMDADGDGVTNLGEYLGGTNPHDLNSVLRVLEIVPSLATNTPAIIRFLARANASYSVQYRNNLGSADWKRLDNGDVPAAPTNRVVEVFDDGAFEKTNRFYRIIAPATN